MHLLLLLACASSPSESLATVATPDPVADDAPPLAESSARRATRVETPAPPLDYRRLRATLNARRAALAARWRDAPPDARPALLAESRAMLLGELTGELFPAWQGTPWEFYGTAAAPGDEAIACGYFVSTTLQHAGFELNRYKLAQQAAAQIAASFAPEESLRWFTDDRAGAIAATKAAGASLWVVGLDFHVGYLWNDGSDVRFCHSNYIGAVGVMCEDAANSTAFAASRVHVLAQLLDDGMLTKWLEGTTIAVHTEPVARPR